MTAMDLAMCKTALGELYLVGSSAAPRNLTKAPGVFLFTGMNFIGDSDSH